jgi:hypothetical protein
VNHSPEIGKLAGALAKAQAKIKAAAFDRVNPHFKNKYATLNSVIDAIRAELTANEIAVIQGTDTADDGALICETMLVHSSGEWIKSALRLHPRDNGAQSVGSALTYGRRYLLAAMTCNASDEDDDANAASAPQKPVKAAPTVQPTTNTTRKADTPKKAFDEAPGLSLSSPSIQIPTPCAPSDAIEIARLAKMLGHSSRAAVISTVAGIVGRPIENATSLTADEAREVIFALNAKLDAKDEVPM